MYRKVSTLAALTGAAGVYAGLLVGVSDAPSDAEVLAVVTFPLLVCGASALTWFLGRRSGTRHYARILLLAGFGLAGLAGALFLTSSMSGLAFAACMVAYAPVLGSAAGWFVSVAPRERDRGKAPATSGSILVRIGAAVALLAWAAQVAFGLYGISSRPSNAAVWAAMAVGLLLLSAGYWRPIRLVSVLAVIGAISLAANAAAQLSGSCLVDRISSVAAGASVLGMLSALLWRRLGSSKADVSSGDPEPGPGNS